MSTIVLLLMCMVYQVMCVPPRCQEVNVETDEVSGQCCLFFKNNVGSSGKTEVVQRFLKSLNKDPTPRRQPSNVQKIFYPDDEIRLRKPVQTKNKSNSDENVATRRLPPVEPTASKNISIGMRVNVDVPDTCTKGYKKADNGECMEVFDDE
ncbi:uncharacterized protein [Diabrotica undecimpunctata]|uniref:uncharacterized protein n=1 Tax=Diabrotica undecimpunctata TaxID=50387 RepID=UPI003B635278